MTDKSKTVIVMIEVSEEEAMLFLRAAQDGRRHMEEAASAVRDLNGLLTKEGEATEADAAAAGALMGHLVALTEELRSLWNFLGPVLERARIHDPSDMKGKPS